MGNVVWLLDRYLEMDQYGEEHELARIQKAVTACGARSCKMEFVGLGYEPDPDERSLVYGSIGFVMSAGHLTNPGPYCNWEEMKCTSYYAKLGRWLLNKDYVMLPLGDLKRRAIDLIDQFGGEVFLRPNDSHKSFSGFVLTEDTLDTNNIYSHALRSGAGSDLVIASPVKPIEAEWRLFCTRDDIVSASLYKRDGKMVMEKGCTGPVAHLSRRILLDLNRPYPFPDPMVVIDICQSNGAYYLMEIGSPSCCGMYACDVDRIVRAATELAEKEEHQYVP